MLCSLVWEGTENISHAIEEIFRKPYSWEKVKLYLSNIYKNKIKTTDDTFKGNTWRLAMQCRFEVENNRSYRGSIPDHNLPWNFLLK